MEVLVNLQHLVNDTKYIRLFQAFVGFAKLLDAARAMIGATARAVDAGVDPRRVRRMVSESKKFVTESCRSWSTTPCR
jgi:alkylation response protein AidB-like acyl-CoA dehydrogenase